MTTLPSLFFVCAAGQTLTEQRLRNSQLKDGASAVQLAERLLQLREGCPRATVGREGLELLLIDGAYSVDVTWRACAGGALSTLVRKLFPDTRCSLLGCVVASSRATTSTRRHTPSCSSSSMYPLKSFSLGATPIPRPNTLRAAATSLARTSRCAAMTQSCATTAASPRHAPLE